jgi:hypothetical protein
LGAEGQRAHLVGSIGGRWGGAEGTEGVGCDESVGDVESMAGDLLGDSVLGPASALTGMVELASRGIGAAKEGRAGRGNFALIADE